jgi:glycosyltransferase involved in cell wall biosynthesis
MDFLFGPAADRVRNMTSSIADYKKRPMAQERVGGLRGKARSRYTDRSKLASVVTITFNSQRTLNRTIDSILGQTYPDIEYIVIDGGSSDGTLDILRARDNDIDFWLSEPDAGISDAFNKGISLAHGAYIALVNSDDWLEPDHISIAVDALLLTKAGFVFGDMTLHPADNNPPFILTGDPKYAQYLPHTMPQINHPTIVSRRSLYEDYGLFDTELSAAMDFEWLLRVHSRGIVGEYSPKILSHMSMEGVSHSNFLHALKEVRDTSVRYGYPSILAQCRYIVRGNRVRLRQALENLMPRAWYEWLRHKINPRFKKIDAS